MEFSGNHIVIIGGSSGIGRAVAEAALSRGARVTITSRSAERAERVAAEIGGGAAGAACDLGDEASVAALFAGIDAVDHVYVAGGSTTLGPLGDDPLAEQLRDFDTRIRGSLAAVRAALPKLREGGSFVFTGGVSTDRPIGGAWVSGLATSTAEQLARVLVMEYPRVRFNAVSPGYTDTPMWDDVMGDGKAEALRAVAEGLPVGKIATPGEVASAVLFLMGNASVTGEVVHVDGGGRLV